MLTFVIPTYNRPHTVGVAIRSIASQVKSDDVEIIVIDDSSPPESKKVLEECQAEFPFVYIRPLDIHIDYSHAFHAMFTAAPQSDWVWTFGDDDILLPGALEFIQGQLAAMPELQFMHVTETKRASGNNGLYKGTLLDLCNTIGWIELTGYITGNITRGSRLHHAAQSPRWARYAKGAFVQSCALLEEFRDDQCAFMDIPCVDAQRAEYATADTMQAWSEQRIDYRYLFAGDAIETMFDEGILHSKLKTKFFRYLSYHLWDRFISSFINDFFEKKQVWDEGTWEKVRKLSFFLEDTAYADALNRDINDTRGLTLLHAYMESQMLHIGRQIGSIGERRTQACYPWTFIEAGVPAVDDLRNDQKTAHYPV